MKTQFHKILLVALVAVVSLNFSCTTQRQFYDEPQGYVDFQIFYDHLNPYGQWIDYPGHGYVWIPDVGMGFEPYSTNGHWVMTDYGWTWVSNYRWGWAPFHYGRWDMDPRLGWFWVPDNHWGPAWVSWRRGNGYYGWAPLRPGMNMGYSGYYDIDRWNFVRDRDFGRPDIHRHIIGKRNYGSIMRNSHEINNTHVDRRRNTTYIAGPAPEEVRRVTGRRISSVTVRDNSRPGTVLKDDQLRIYRPQVQSSSSSTRATRPAPPRVYSRDEIRPLEQRNNRIPEVTSPNERRREKIEQLERQQERQRIEQRRQQTEQNQRIERRQQMERRQQIEQRQQNGTRQSRPLGQQKREEKSQQIEQQQQIPAQTPSNSSPSGGRRR